MGGGGAGLCVCVGGGGGGGRGAGGHALCCGLIKYFFIQKERKKIYMYERFTVEKVTEVCVYGEWGGGGGGCRGMLILRRVIIFNAATLIQQCRI